MTDDIDAAEQRLIDKIMAVPTWAALLHNARDIFFRNDPRHAVWGRILSTALLATENGTSALAVTGNKGAEPEWLIIVTKTGIVEVTIAAAAVEGMMPTYAVNCYGLDAVTSLSVESPQDYFESTDRPVERSMSFTIALNGRNVTFGPAFGPTRAVLDADHLAAFVALRDAQCTAR